MASGWEYNDRLVFVLIPSAFFIYLQSGAKKKFTVLQSRILTTPHKRVTRYLRKEVQWILEKGDRFLGDIQRPLCPVTRPNCMHALHINKAHSIIKKWRILHIN